MFYYSYYINISDDIKNHGEGSYTVFKRIQWICDQFQNNKQNQI